MELTWPRPHPYDENIGTTPHLPLPGRRVWGRTADAGMPVPGSPQSHFLANPEIIWKRRVKGLYKLLLEVWGSPFIIHIFFNFSFLLVHLRERDRESISRGRGRGRGRSRLPAKPEAQHGAGAQHLEIMTWAEGGCPVIWAPRVPLSCIFWMTHAQPQIHS